MATGPAALEDSMPLLCDLGWHRPQPMARWNEGFYFTTCERCGCDLVRTAYGRWGVPRGYRVVWQAAPPKNAVSAALVRERDGAPELPIQEVLRHLHSGDSENGHSANDVAANPTTDPDEPAEGESESDCESVAAESAPSPPDVPRLKVFPASRIPDFMDRPTGANDWEAQARTYLVKAAPAAAAAGGEPTAESREPMKGPSGLGWLRSLAPRLFNRDAAADADAARDDIATEAAESQRARRVLLGAIPIVVALFALIIWTVLSDSPPPPSPATEMPGAEAVSGEGTPAFVTAGILNCRAGPARESRSVMVLGRGDGVMLLAQDGEWVSLSLDGRQCWALARYLSVARPG